MLEDILKERYVPEPSSNLAYRIIEAAKPRGDEQGFSWAAMRRIFSEIFVIPQPVPAMAAILLLGVAAGFYYTSQQDMSMKLAKDNLSTFATAELSVEYGDFL